MLRKVFNAAVCVLLLICTTEILPILCIPFAYSKGWKATDNGKSVKVIKVNGMFCGIVLKPGTHNIKLNYTTVILLLLLVGSILMFSLGVIGYYIAKIYDEVKMRPRYIISEVVKSKDE